ncbi:15934_t:CDS:1, partial [Dentiscutata heterogama]
LISWPERPLMCANENGHIVEYLQLKITKKINILIDQEHRANIKQYKFYLKDDKIVSDKGSIFDVLYPGVMQENIQFKNGSIYDLRK